MPKTGHLWKWLLAVLMFAPLGSCLLASATFTDPSQPPATRDLSIAALFSAGLLIAAGVWLGLLVFLFRSPRVNRHRRLHWSVALTICLPLAAPVFFFTYLWRSPEERAARPPETNRAHLLKLWTIPVVFGALLLVGMVAAVARGSYLGPALMLTVLPAFFVLRRVNQWRLRRLMSRSDPDGILRYLARQTRGFRWMPHGECLKAGVLAGAAATMGHFERARRELATVDWERQPPLYRGLRDAILALMALVEERDSAKALALARSARSLAEVPGAFPGSAASRASLDATVAAAELLAGEARPDMVTGLEAMVSQLPEAQRALPVCALAVHYAEKGDPGRAQQFRKQLVELVPHARALIELAGASEPGPESAQSSPASWSALIRSLTVPSAALAALVALVSILPPDVHQVRHSRPVIIPSPVASGQDGPSGQTASNHKGRPAPEALPAMIRDAEAALDEGDDDRAIQLLDQILGVTPDDTDSLFHRSIAYDNKSDHVRAIQDLDRALRLRPDNAAGLDNRGLAYLSLGDFDRAIVDFDQAIRLQPTNPLAFDNRGVAYVEKEDFPQAIRDFEEAARLRPGFKAAIQGREKAERRKYANEHPIRSLLRAFR